MSTPILRKSSPEVPEALLTSQAVNIRFANLREQFRSIGIERPTPFIAWQHKLTETDADRVSAAFSGRAAKADAELLPKAELCFQQMEKGILRKAAA